MCGWRRQPRSTIGEQRAAVDEVELGEQRCAARDEIGLEFCRDRPRVAELHGLWIAVHAVDPVLVVQMRTAGETGAADITDQLALAHALALRRALGEPGQVSVQGRDTASVLDDDGIAVAAVAAAHVNPAVTG